MSESAADTRRLREEAFRRYVEPEIPALLRFARGMTAQPADAEDLVQDTLIRAFRAVDRFDGAHPRAWLLTILRNTEAKRNRRHRPELLHQPESQLGQLSPAFAGRQETPEGVVVDEQFDAVVAAVFNALPEKHRAVVHLVDIDGLSYAEAARALGVPQGTVFSRLHRARSRIRDRLAEAGLVPKRGDK